MSVADITRFGRCSWDKPSRCEAACCPAAHQEGRAPRVALHGTAGEQLTKPRREAGLGHGPTVDTLAARPPSCHPLAGAGCHGCSEPAVTPGGPGTHEASCCSHSVRVRARPPQRDSPPASGGTCGDPRSCPWSSARSWFILCLLVFQIVLFQTSYEWSFFLNSNLRFNLNY